MWRVDILKERPMNIKPKDKFTWILATLALLAIASAFTDDPFALVGKIFEGL